MATALVPSTISSRTAASTITVASDGLSQRTSTINCGYDCGKGSRSRAWPAPQVDGIEAVAAKYAEAWPAWGHRKIVALMRADGHVVSTSTVERALRQRALLLPRGFRADRKSWAVIRRRVFHDPPTSGIGSGRTPTRAPRFPLWVTQRPIRIRHEQAGSSSVSFGAWLLCQLLDATQPSPAAGRSPGGWIAPTATDAQRWCMHAHGLDPAEHDNGFRANRGGDVVAIHFAACRSKRPMRDTTRRTA